MSSPIPPSMAANRWVRSLQPSARDALFAGSEPIAFRRGEMLYRSIDGTGAFYGLVEGYVKISTLDAKGHEAILTIMEPGNWFGEMSMVDKLGHTHDATAIGPVKVLALREPAFDGLMHQVDFARGIAALLASRMRLLFAVFEDATLQSTQARIARRLLHLSRGDATLAEERRPLVQVSQHVLAMMLGITRQTLSVELKAMADAGAIATRYGGIEVASLEHLIRLAGPQGGQGADVAYRMSPGAR